MDINNVIFLGLSGVQLIAIPIMLAMFAFAVLYGIYRGGDDDPVLWRSKRAQADKEAPARKQAAGRKAA
jgi:hypothetical protein